MPERSQDKWVSRQTLAWLIVAQGVTLLPLFIRLPLWLPVLWLMALFWRIQIYRGAWSFPSNKIKIVVGLLSIMGLLASYSGSLGVEPLVAFLAVSFILKLLEARARYDILLIIYVGFIGVAAQFIFFQTMLMAIYACFTLILLLCAWNSVYRSSSVPAQKQLLASATLFLQSLPMMLLLFLVLPRLGTLWHVPIPQSAGVTGFSDSMSPGDFSSLSQSRAVAFRVTFDDPTQMPPRSEWYWRGLVMENFDGRRWDHADASAFRRRDASTGPPEFWQLQSDDNQRVVYDVLMEPHQQQWLFSLMTPVRAESTAHRIFFAPGFLTKSTRPVASRSQYRVVSALRYRVQPKQLEARVSRRNLSLPEGSNPGTRAMVDQWREQGLQGRALIEKALRMYRESFVYTLQPPPLGQNSIDEFLFTSQRGFCEHFASSFVVMMREAGIPARVVVGYQGGEYNQIENYIVVRQSDAHAWAEVWLPDEGWQRVDPTAAVSPLRIEQGLANSLDVAEQPLVRPFFSGNLATYLQMRLDALSYSWHRWVLGYDAQRQADILTRLFGGTQAWRVALYFGVLLGLLLFAYFLRLTWHMRPRTRYPEQGLYTLLLRKLRRKGFKPDPGETPAQFLHRVAVAKPKQRGRLHSIAALYNRISYQGNDQLLAQFKRQVMSLNLD